MGISEEHDRLSHLARNCAGINLRRASRTVTHYYDRRLLAICGLRATQVPLLIILHLEGPMAINAMAASLNLDRTTLSRNLKPLEERGLLSVAPGADQRTHIVTLTQAGADTLRMALKGWEAAQADVEQILGKTRYQSLLNDLADLEQLINKA